MSYFFLIIILILNILLQVAEKPRTIINEDRLIERIKKLENNMERMAEDACIVHDEMLILKNDYKHNTSDIFVIKWISIISFLVIISIILFLGYIYVTFKTKGGYISVGYRRI